MRIFVHMLCIFMCCPMISPYSYELLLFPTKTYFNNIWNIYIFFSSCLTKSHDSNTREII